MRKGKLINITTAMADSLNETQYTWKTGIFRNRFEIFKQDFPVGELRKEYFSRKVEGELFCRRILFRTKGIFRNEIRIIDLHNEQELGVIRIKNLMKRTAVYYRDREYYCRFDNILRTRWNLGDEKGQLVRYHSRAYHGVISSLTNDEVLILSGFFIRNFVKQRTATIAAMS